ncbi:7TM diverse intracellular signaling domain-containing protein [Thermoflexibacter ruber]|uniref:Serine phosphatase RsbU, regulator of sigma subunit n=1 Tax=Thermoflexibacter ruber TaxID=1003 RepID=A0A1I2JDT3_9BACT|nr:7TM diverse intracellular signaling domain-containing protein [Thermoflexibacter ruber]SFF52130.1 Serine phosphatase RsbU, regulator of sigma subunit [Thermoflexibacter ruber]
MKKYLFSLLLFLTCLHFTYAQQVIVLDNISEPIDIGLATLYYQDEHGSLTLKQILSTEIQGKFQKVTQEIPNFQSTNAAVWLKFIVENKASQEDFYLELGSAYLDSIALYVLKDEQLESKKVGGDNYPFIQREILVTNFLYHLNIPQGEQRTYYLRVTSLQPLAFPIRIGNIKSLYGRNHVADYVQGLYFGFMLLMFLYNLFVYFSVRERIYLYYVAYVFSTTVFIAGIYGYFFEFIWADYPLLNNYIVIAPAFFKIFAVLFTRDFLNTKKNAPRIHWISNVFIGTSILIVILLLLKQAIPALIIAQAGLLFMAIYFLIVGIIVFRKGYSPAKFYLVAWVFLIIGIIAQIIGDANLIPRLAYISPLQIGSALEVLLLSFALADKINTYRAEREKAQAHALLVQKEANETLENKVVERTKELSDALDLVKIQKEELDQTNEELTITLDVVERQKLDIERKNLDIISSINYAVRIQNALLPSINRIFEQVTNDVFIFYRPRDIVSGDFYWLSEEIFPVGDNSPHTSQIVFAVADCTGHGVPGAFMSMIGNNLLNQTVNIHKITQPNQILEHLNKTIFTDLKQSESGMRDGMDIAIITLTKSAKTKKYEKLEFSGAMNSLCYMQNNKFFEIKGTKRPIGGRQRENEKEYELHEISLAMPTYIYLYSDGFQDQFGGEKGMKFLSKRFKEILYENHHQDFATQREILETVFEDWKGNERQIDDVLVVGMKI